MCSIHTTPCMYHYSVCGIEATFHHRPGVCFRIQSLSHRSITASAATLYVAAFGFGCRLPFEQLALPLKRVAPDVVAAVAWRFAPKWNGLTSEEAGRFPPAKLAVEPDATPEGPAPLEVAAGAAGCAATGGAAGGAAGGWLFVYARVEGW